MAKFVDVCLIPIDKKYVATYKKQTRAIGKLLVKHGALSSVDFVSDIDGDMMSSFAKKMKLKPNEVLILAMAEFKNRTHSEKVFKSMSKDPAMKKVGINSDWMTDKRAIVGGFSELVKV